MECLCWEQWLNLFCQNASPYSIILNRDSFCWVISSHSTLYLISTLFQLLSIVFGNLIVVSFLRFLDFILLKICWVSWIFSSTFNLIHISTLFLLLFMYPFLSLFPSEMDRWMNSNRLWAIVFSSPTLFWWLYFYVHESFLSWHVYVVLSIRKIFYVRYCCSYIFCKFHSWLLPSCFLVLYMLTDFPSGCGLPSSSPPPFSPYSFIYTYMKCGMWKEIFLIHLFTLWMLATATATLDINQEAQLSVH